MIKERTAFNVDQGIKRHLLKKPLKQGCWVLTFIVLAMLFATPSLCAEEDWTLEKILERYYRVRGGPAATQGIQSLHVTGKLEMREGRYAIILIKKKPHFLRTTLKIGKRREVTAYDGTQAWEMIEGHDVPRSVRILPQEESRIYAQEAEFGLFGPLFDYKNQKMELEFLGIKTIRPHSEVDQTQPDLSELDENLQGAIECFHLRGVLPNGDAIEFFLQKNTFWELKITTHPQNSGRNQKEIRNHYFSDYRTVGPVKEAFRVQTYDGSGQYLSTLWIDKIAFNVGIYKRYFDLGSVAE